MKIQDLLEAKFSPKAYAYHATMGENIRSILKHGLIPNKRDDGYGSDDHGLAFGYSLAPLPGIYFTRKRADAETIAKHIDSDAIVIICKVQPQELEMDEDRLTGEIVDEPFLIKKFKRSIDYVRDLEEITDEQINDFSQDYAQEIIKRELSDLDPRLLQNVYPDMVQYIKALLTFYINSETGAFDESDVKKYQEILTKKLKSMVKSNKGTNHTFKLNKPISFSGANKIVGMYSPRNREGWGDLGDFEGHAYHKVANPLRLISIKH